MVAKNRHSLPVDPKFVEQLKELRRKVFANGGDTSLRKLTEEISHKPIFDEIERRVLDILSESQNIEKNLIRFDKRGRG